MLRGLLILFLLCAGLSLSEAQIDQVWRYTYPEFSDGDANKLYFRLENNNFLKNNEFFGDYTEGYTLLGYSLQPSFMYYAGSRLRLKAGAHLLHYSGDSSISMVIPVFSAHVRLNQHLSLIMGALRGDLQHRLIEPLFNPENQYSRPVEKGFQFIYDNKRFYLDAWADWEQFIELGDTKPERFTAGISALYKVITPDSDWALDIPFQFIATHLGGQISDYEEPMQTLANIATGFKFSKKTGEGFIRQVSFSTYGAIYNDVTEASGLPFTTGKAIYPVGQIDYRNGLFMLGYWRANNFIAPKGSALFQSISDYQSDFYQQKRELINAKFAFTKTFMEKIHFSILLESYYDLANSQLEYAYGFNLVFNPNFFIKQIQFR